MSTYQIRKRWTVGLRILEGVGLNGESMHEKLNHGWLLGIPLTKTVHTHTHTCTHTHMHTRTHAQMHHTCTHARTHTRTHAHTQVTIRYQFDVGDGDHIWNWECAQHNYRLRAAVFEYDRLGKVRPVILLSSRPVKQTIVALVTTLLMKL